MDIHSSKSYPFKGLSGPGSNYYIIGFMGSGKTHWGRIWAQRNNLFFTDLDEVIEKNAGSTVAEIFERKGEDYFRKIEAEALRSCSFLQNAIVACGGGTPCFFANMQWMNEQGNTIYISCTIDEIFERVLIEQGKRPLIRKLNRAEILFYIEQKLSEREPFYSQAKLKVESKELTADSFKSIITTFNS